MNRPQLSHILYGFCMGLATGGAVWFALGVWG